jgi:hypothetical protein
MRRASVSAALSSARRRSADARMLLPWLWRAQTSYIRMPPSPWSAGKVLCSQRQPHNLAYLTQIRKPEALPARPVTLLSSYEQCVGFPKFGWVAEMGAVFVLAIVGRRQYRVQLAGFNRPPGARLFLARRLRALAGPPIRSISQQARHYRRPTQRATARRSAAGVGWRAPWRTAGSARQRGSSEQNTILVRFYQAVREGPCSV